ncbi:MAG: CerR family C-terminal domain-containing protein, partial [Planctomycetota bacterium]|nr:CerR family C-terminal domain-containing protein [Planctomycetota bacterium]
MSAAATRQRLLEAAGPVFAEKGFRAANVREICRRAGANVAAVNYHFGGKQGLYLEVFRGQMRSRLEKYPPHLGTTPDAPAAQRLRAFIRAAVNRIFDAQDLPPWFGRLMAWEMVEPTAALDILVQEFLEPQRRLLAQIVGELLGKPPHSAEVSRCCWSVVGQWLIYHCARNVILRLQPD